VTTAHVPRSAHLTTPQGDGASTLFGGDEGLLNAGLVLPPAVNCAPVGCLGLGLLWEDDDNNATASTGAAWLLLFASEDASIELHAATSFCGEANLLKLTIAGNTLDLGDEINASPLVMLLDALGIAVDTDGNVLSFDAGQIASEFAPIGTVVIGHSSC